MKKLFLRTLLSGVMMLLATSAWADAGDITTNADIDFSNPITDGVVNGTVYSTTTGNIPANRAYIALPASSGARSLTIGNVTGSSLTPNPSPRGEGSIYSIDGRKVSDGQTGSRLRKGVYIQNGQKHVVR